MENSSQSGLTQTTFDWAIFLPELESMDDEMLAVQIRNNLSIDMTEVADDKGFTLLHHAVLKGVPGKVEALIGLVKKI